MLIAGALVGAFVGGVVVGRLVWLRWVPALKAALHRRWVNAVRAAVETLPPAERWEVLGGHACTGCTHRVAVPCGGDGR